MLMSGQWFDEISVDDFTFIEEKILSMDSKDRSYLCVEDSNGDYIQIGGCLDRFSVEARIYIKQTAISLIIKQTLVNLKLLAMK